MQELSLSNNGHIPFPLQVMPFVATLKDLVATSGIASALALTSPFDEQSVLESNLAYLADTLEVN